MKRLADLIRNPDAVCGILNLFLSFVKARWSAILVSDRFSNGSKELSDKCIEKNSILEKEVRI